jgi:putative adhesin
MYTRPENRVGPSRPWLTLASATALLTTVAAPRALALGAALGAGVGTAIRLSADPATGAALPVAHADTAREFHWRGHVDGGRWVRVRDLSGSIRVERASGAEVEISGRKSGHGTADDVTITMQRTGADSGDVLVCAVWAGTSRCDERGYSSHSHHDWRRHHDEEDVSVDFTVRVPPGVRVVAATVNGDVDVSGATADVEAESVNGGVDASTDGGPVRASSVNGAVRARMTKVAGSDRLDYSSVNGSVTVTLPADLKADVELETVNGSVRSDFPISVTGSIEPQHLRGTIGGGGLRLHVETVNGSVELKKL